MLSTQTHLPRFSMAKVTEQGKKTPILNSAKSKYGPKVSNLTVDNTIFYTSINDSGKNETDIEDARQELINASRKKADALVQVTDNKGKQISLSWLNKITQSNNKSIRLTP